MKRVFLSVMLILNTICEGHAQQADSLMIRKISDELMANAGCYENPRYLCKEIGPRLLRFCKMHTKAVEATARMLKEAYADTVYLQPCKVPHWVRGEKETGYISLANGNRYDLHLCALGNSVATPSDGITASVIEIKDFKELEELEKRLKERSFFNHPMSPLFINTFDAYRESGIYRGRGATRQQNTEPLRCWYVLCQ